jgi:predicted nucleic acid-binding protein
VLPVERDILVDTARVQALLSLRLPDAIYEAAALAAGCEVIISDDKRLKVPAGLVLQPMT